MVRGQLAPFSFLLISQSLVNNLNNWQTKCLKCKKIIYSLGFMILFVPILSASCRYYNHDFCRYISYPRFSTSSFSSLLKQKKKTGSMKLLLIL